MAPRTQVNSATGIMGVSGSGKSSLAATLAKYLWRNHRKVLLYYNCDGGGFPAEVQACIAAGIVRVFRMRTRDTSAQDLAFETCARSAQGWWPRRINPTTGEVEPGVEMVPPMQLQFQMRCPSGHLVKSVISAGMLTPAPCPECKVMVGKAEMKVSKSLVRNKGFEDVGGVFFDGLSSMLSWELMELGGRAGRMELRGEEAAIGGKVSSGEMKFGGTTRSHVGFVQTRGEELVHLTLGIPGLVVPPVFTMLTHEDVDERGLNIRGPKIAGRAKTDEAPQWFGNMLEAAKIPAETGNGTQRTLFLSEFTDANGVRHLLKHRGSPGTMPEKLQDDPDGETSPDKAFVQFNLGFFFELLNAALEQKISQVMAEFPDAPGLPEGIVDIGGGVAPPAAPVVQPSLKVLGGGAPAPAAPLAPKALKKPAKVGVPPAVTPAPLAPATPQASVADAVPAQESSNPVSDLDPTGAASAPEPQAVASEPLAAAEAIVRAVLAPLAPPPGAPRMAPPAGRPRLGSPTPQGASIKGPGAAPRPPVRST